MHPQGFKQGGAGGTLPDFMLMLLYVQAVTTKARPKFRKTREEKVNSFQVISSVTHTK